MFILSIPKHHKSAKEKEKDGGWEEEGQTGIEGECDKKKEGAKGKRKERKGDFL